MAKPAAKIKSYRVRLMLNHSRRQGRVRAYSEAQASAYWAKEYLGDVSLRAYVKAEEIDERFNEDDICPACGLTDPRVASGELTCPNCH